MLCGDPLVESWHADHVEPFSAGGLTEIFNGQGLCLPCNLRKGDRVVRSGGWPVNMPLRDWQHRAWAACTRQDRTETDFLCVATPGGGKTTFGLRVAHDRMQAVARLRVVIVVPSDHLKMQWQAAAARTCGLQLQRDWTPSNGIETRDFDGLVVTYQAVASQPDVFRTQCDRAPTLVIFDEIHHAGDAQTWGQSIRRAFETARWRLLLSGTPFRTDGRAIPFVRYGPDGVVLHDFLYGYSDALADGVCRPVMFPRFDGEMVWWNADGLRKATFRDEVPEAEAAQRLRTALDPAGKWLRDVLRDADRQLAEIRAESDPAAGGLIVCSHQQHAREVAALLERVTSTSPTLVLSEDGDGSARIERFKTSVDRWMVAVRMVSEGVDIPRLRVGVYATHVISRLFFRQVVGRFVRKQADLDEQVGHLFIPDDDVLAAYAAQIKDEVTVGLDALEEQIRERMASPTREPPSSSPFAFGSSGPAELSGVTTDGDAIGRTEIERARLVAAQFGRSSLEDALFTARILRSVGAAEGATAQARVEPSATMIDDDRRSLRTSRKRKVTQFGAMLFRAWDGSVTQDRAYMLVNVRLKAESDGKPVSDATLEQLDRGNRLLDAWRDELHAAGQEGAGRVWADEWARGTGR